jgi:hypothetical protein
VLVSDPAQDLPPDLLPVSHYRPGPHLDHSKLCRCRSAAVQERIPATALDHCEMASA